MSNTNSRDPMHRVWKPASYVTCKDHGLQPANEYCGKCVSSLEEHNAKLREALEGTPDMLRYSAAETESWKQKYVDLSAVCDRLVALLDSHGIEVPECECESGFVEEADADRSRAGDVDDESYREDSQQADSRDGEPAYLIDTRGDEVTN